MGTVTDEQESVRPVLGVAGVASQSANALIGLTAELVESKKVMVDAVTAAREKTNVIRGTSLLSQLEKDDPRKSQVLDLLLEDFFSKR